MAIKTHMIRDLRVTDFAGLVPKLEAVQYYRGRWFRNLTLEPAAVKSLKRMAVASSAGSSTRIEGATLSDAQALEVIQKRKNIQTDRSAAEVLGYSEALRQILDARPKGRTVLTREMIGRIHKTMMQYTSEPFLGSYRESEVNISDGMDGVLYVCALPDLVPFFMKNCLKRLQDKWNDPAQSRIITVAEFIVEFLAIHPFADGNGRCARLLTTYLLLQADHGYLEYVSLEREIEKRKIEYYLALNKTQKTGVLNPWLHFFLDVLRSAQSALDRQLRAAGPAPGNKRPLLYKSVLNIIQARRVIRAGELAELTGKSPAGVRKVLARLVADRKVRAQGRNKGRYYQAVE
jgi:Fic family protein